MSNFEKAWSLVKMPKGDVMYMAECDTGSYNWRGFGDTPEHALAAIAAKWERWVENTGATIPLDEFLQNTSVDKIISGGATMDEEYEYLHDGEDFVRDEHGDIQEDLSNLVDIPEGREYRDKAQYPGRD